jgi:predicted RNA-binding protein associated with RNAse of E/G family
MSCLELCDWELADRNFDRSLLWLLEPEAGYAVTLTWSDARVGGWYVNVQEPFMRTERGLKTMDLMLDAIVRRDGTWSWKDEDEFEAAVSRGLLAPEGAAWLRDEGLRAVRKIVSKELPFDRDWASWQPDSDWDIPKLPLDWDRL